MSAKIKVHNADLFLDVLQNSDWTPSPNCTDPTLAMKKLHEARHYAASQPGQGGGAAQSPMRQRRLPEITTMSSVKIQEELASTERANRQRDTFIQKQLVREEETKVRLEQSMRETQRRAKEKTLQREREFEERCEEFCDANATIIDDINTIVCEDDAWVQRKRERLYAEWTAQVFQPMQAQIDSQLSNMSHADIAEKRRYMFQCFLDESNRKRGGVFRDIIMECDYDPLTMAREATLTYRAVPVTEDPVKDRFTREGGNKTLRALRDLSSTSGGAANESRSGGSSGGSVSGDGVGTVRVIGGYGSLGVGAPREATLPVTMWSNVDVTPYGRYHADGKVAKQVKPKFNASAVVMDHYKVPTREEGTQLLNTEMPSKGKRVYDKPLTNVF
ncbi:Hypothetical protein, putative [Bodo saltans]|uniref:Uncharacterized protein n=1 Tax=Bodo saltans TaxID=75058 RepID=A0A0S4JQ26_BODSA|nr:Hypothetical protein, putative [Bodo saltans]|eukprot:CUG93618.1 Hypothetical protein, putative [Bodo saltans]